MKTAWFLFRFFVVPVFLIGVAWVCADRLISNDFLSAIVQGLAIAVISVAFGLRGEAQYRKEGLGSDNERITRDDLDQVD